MQFIDARNNKLLENLLDLFYNKYCLLCGTHGNYICARCALAGQSPSICPACKKGSLHGKTHLRCTKHISLDSLIGLYKYNYIKPLILQLKFKHVYEIEECINTILTYKKENLPYSWYDNHIITYIPLYSKRLKERGYNQALIIAKALSSIIKSPVKKMLMRTYNTQPMSHLPYNKRPGLLNAFAITEEQIPDNIILVDDVYTSGHTLNAAATVIKKHKSRCIIHGFCLAIA